MFEKLFQIDLSQKFNNVFSSLFSITFFRKKKDTNLLFSWVGSDKHKWFGVKRKKDVLFLGKKKVRMVKQAAKRYEKRRELSSTR